MQLLLSGALHESANLSMHALSMLCMLPIIHATYVI